MKETDVKVILKLVGVARSQKRWKQGKGFEHAIEPEKERLCISRAVTSTQKMACNILSDLEVATCFGGPGAGEQTN